MNGERTVAARRAALRTATLQLVLGVVALDAVALAIYYFGGVAHGSTQAKQIFTGAWTGATALVVVLLLKRVRRVRYS